MKHVAKKDPEDGKGVFSHSVALHSIVHKYRLFQCQHTFTHVFLICPYGATTKERMMCTSCERRKGLYRVTRQVDY